MIFLRFFKIMGLTALTAVRQALPQMPDTSQGKAPGFVKRKTGLLIF